MSKPEQVLIIEPQNELKFKGPFNVPVTSYMGLTNPSDKKVLFKIKTTAPKKYCVRPNSGLLEAGGHIEIAISLQPLDFYSPEKNKHKFMVQSVFAPDGPYQIEQLWKDTSVEQLMDSKLKCVFEHPEKPHNEVMSDAPTKLCESSEKEAPLDVDDIKHLMESEMHLRQENCKLNEEILHLRQNTSAVRNASASNENKYTPPVAQDNMVTLVIVGIILGIVGMVFGKFVL